MRLCDTTMFWSESGGGVRRYLEAKRRWLLRTRPGLSHLLLIPAAGDCTSEEGPHTTIGVKAARIFFSPGYRTPLRRSGVIGALERWEPDLIECGSPFLMRRAVSEFRRRTGTAVFDYYHACFPRNYTAVLGDRFGLLRKALDAAGWRILRKSYADSSRIFLSSAAVARELALHGISRTELAPLGVDLELFRAKLGSDRHPVPTILFAGRLTEEKGLSKVIECHSLLSRSRHVRLLIIGDGVLRPAVEKLQSENPDVRFRGFVGQEALAASYRESWVLVSGAPAETLGLCFLESLASGTPVVGLSGSGLMDEFPQGVARAVTAHTGEALASAASFFLDNPPDPSECRTAASGFGWDERLEHLLSREVELAGLPGAGGGLAG